MHMHMHVTWGTGPRLAGEPAQHCGGTGSAHNHHRYLFVTVRTPRLRLVGEYHVRKCVIIQQTLNCVTKYMNLFSLSLYIYIYIYIRHHASGTLGVSGLPLVVWCLVCVSSNKGPPLPQGPLRDLFDTF